MIIVNNNDNLKKGGIPVVFTPDENYMFQTAVAILSILDSKKDDTRYHFYILVSDTINRESFKYIDTIKKIHDDFVYTATFFDSSSMDKLKVNTAHLTSSAFYRLILSEIYDFDRCMYHDGDILVYDDLSDMYNIDMQESYIASVKTITQHQGSVFDQKMIDEWGFPSMDQYVFSGDLTIDLRNIRKNNITKKFIEEMKRGYPQNDQDVLNYCCYNHIHFLPLRYCMLNRWIYNDEIFKFKNQIYTKAEIMDAKTNPAIVHFAGAIVKPWVNIRAAYAKEWWKFAKKLLNAREYEIWHNEVELLTNKRDWSYIVDSVKKMKGNIYIFGYTKYAIGLLESLQKSGINIKAFVDNDTTKYGVESNGKKVISVKEAISDKCASFIIASQNAYGEIIFQLKEQGVDSSRIYRYEGKTEKYYLALDPEYYEYEYRDMMAPVLGINVWNMDVNEIKKYDSEDKWHSIWR